MRFSLFQRARTAHAPDTYLSHTVNFDACPRSILEPEVPAGSMNASVRIAQRKMRH